MDRKRYFKVRLNSPQRGRWWYAEYVGAYATRTVIVYDSGEVLVGGRDIRVYHEPLYEEEVCHLEPFEIGSEEFETTWRKYMESQDSLAAGAHPRQRYFGGRGDIGLPVGRRWYYSEYVNNQLTREVIIYATGQVDVGGKDYPLPDKHMESDNPVMKHYEISMEEFEAAWEKYVERYYPDHDEFGWVGIPHKRYFKSVIPGFVEYAEYEGLYSPRHVVIYSDGTPPEISGIDNTWTTSGPLPYHGKGVPITSERITSDEFERIWTKYTQGKEVPHDRPPWPIWHKEER